MNVSVQERMLSLWPSTWDQKHNRLRLHLIVQTVDELTGTDYAWYNRIMDALEYDNHSAFIKEVMETKNV